jgi:hypothetical protein
LEQFRPTHLSSIYSWRAKRLGFIRTHISQPTVILHDKDSVKAVPMATLPMVAVPVTRSSIDIARLMPPRIYRYAATIAGLFVFVGLSCLYAFDRRNLYTQILRWYGVAPFRSPFLDTSAWLAVWECARQGLDVISVNPCDVLQRGYSSSPLWIAASTVPLGVRDTAAVGWILDLVFLLSLSLLPLPRSFAELIITMAATLSTMVVFALERANADVLVFLMVLAAGLLTECRPFARMLGYSVALVAALLKYYPIMVLVIVFREAVSIFVAISALMLCCLTLFLAEYHNEIARGLSSVTGGAYNTDMFAARNVPFLLGEAVGSAAERSGWGSMVQRTASAGIYALLLGCSLTICSRLLGVHQFRNALTLLTWQERVLLVIGSAVIAGCFLAGPSTGYRGVFFLLIIPGLLAISRNSARGIRNLSLGTCGVILLLMWSECFRLALYRALEYRGVPEMLAEQLKLLFWIFREFGWWWTLSVMLAVLVDFVWDSPVVRRTSQGLDRLVPQRRMIQD